jgi:heterodisulfide reductase subunit A-like polyferredoxin
MGIRDIIRMAIFYITLLFELIKYSYEKATRAEYAQYRTRCVEDKIAIVTGANTGIGKATVLELVKRGATVILACRNPLLGEVAMKEIRSKTQAGKMV